MTGGTTRGIILAAGRGSRLGNMTEAMPKGMVELGGHPLIAWQMAVLRSAGIAEIAVVTGYRAETFAPLGLARFHNPRWSETNMVMSLACAEEWLRGDTCIVSYADIFYAPDDIARLAATQADLAVTYDPNWLALWEERFDDPLDDAETFRLDGTRLREIGKHPGSTDEVEGQYMGLVKFEPGGWSAVSDYLGACPPEKRDRLDMTSLLQNLIERGVAIETCPIANDWGEVDHPSDLEFYEARLRDGSFSWARDLDFHT